MSSLKYILIVISVFFLSGCYHATINAHHEPTANYKNAQASNDQITLAIMNGGKAAGWRMDAANPGIIIATRKEGRQQAVATIVYDSKHYSIDYNHSKVIGNSANVWEVYDDWFSALNNAIQGQMDLLHEAVTHQA